MRNQRIKFKLMNSVTVISSLGSLYRKAQRSDYRSRRLDELRGKPLEPADFCARWITSIDPNDRGYYSACVRELAKATGLSERTVNGWGADFAKRPKYIIILLRKEDLIRQMRLLLDKFDQLEE